MRVGRRASGLAAGLSLVALVAGSTAAGAAGAGESAVSAVAAPGPNATPRLPLSPQPGPGVVEGPVPHVVGGSTLRPSQVIQLPSAASCVKSLRIGFVHPKRIHLRSLSAYLGRRHIIRRPPPASLTLRSLPKGRFKLRVIVRTRSSLIRSRTRFYQSCA